MSVIRSNGFSQNAGSFLLFYLCDSHVSSRQTTDILARQHDTVTTGIRSLAGTSLLLIKMYKYAVWHLTCRLQWAIFSIKLKKCQGRQGEGMGACSDAAVCTLWAQFSSAGIHLTDAFGCQQLNKPRFEGSVLYIGLSSAKSANVFECLASWSLIQSSLLSCTLWSSYRWWQWTVYSRKQGQQDVTSLHTALIESINLLRWWIRIQSNCCFWAELDISEN